MMNFILGFLCEDTTLSWIYEEREEAWLLAKEYCVFK